MPYARNKNAVAICNRSGHKMFRRDMVEDGYLRGLLVHPDWYDPPHPQEEPFDPEEGIAIYKPAPDLIPVPPAATLTVGTRVGSTVTLTWVQPDPPATTVRAYQIWRSTNGGTQFTLLAQVTPVVPPDIFVQAPDLTPGENVPAVTGLTYTDTTTAAGYQYYVITITADGGREGGNGYSSGPSNTVTVS